MKSKLKNISNKREKFFRVMSDVISKDITEKTKLSDVVDDAINDADRDKPIMTCTLSHDLGLESLSVYELYYQCRDVFDIDEEIDAEISTVTVQQLYNFVSEYGKGD